MTQNKRIVVNVLATYGRSLLALVCGLCTGRWVLHSLGEVDFGLFGLLGGLMSIVTFFNGLFASAMARFYAVAVGASHKSGEEAQGLQLCREWFNTALFIHTALPLLAIVIGYPCGEWAIRNFLTIPTGRIESCVWVFRYACASCFVSMVNVPFRAMYTARQEIAEMTLYSVMQTICNFFFVYYMITHPGEWLERYAFGVMIIAVVPQVLICLRACVRFPECRFQASLLVVPQRIKQLFKFVTAQFWAAITGLAQGQGHTILVNKFLGPRYNAAMSVGNTVTANTMSLSSSLLGAFSPAVMNAAGEGDFDRMRRFAFRACKFSAILFLIFVIPAALELDALLTLWLDVPPPSAALFCIFLMLGEFMEKVMDGYSMAIFADGHIGRYQFRIGNDCLLSVVTAGVFLWMGMGMMGVCLSFVILKTLVIVIRLYWGQQLVQMRASLWVKDVFLPILVFMFLTIGAGLSSRFFMPQSIVRIVVTTLVCEAVFLPSVWWILNRDEREFVVKTLQSKFHINHGVACALMACRKGKGCSS